MAIRGKKSIADTYVSILPETSRVASEIAKSFRAVDSEAKQAGRRWRDEMNRELGDVRVKLNVDGAQARADVERIKTQIERTEPTMKVRVDQASTGAMVAQLAAGGTRAGQAFSSSFASAAKVNAGFVAVGLMPALATALADVGGAVQQLAGAGLVLPGVMAGVGASFSIATLGASGMSDALDAVNKAADGTQASVDVANKALGELAPNAASTVTTLAGFKGTLTDLQQIAGQNMFAGVSDGLTNLAGNLLPATARGIDGISRGFNENLLQAMSSLGSDSSQGFLDRILGNTADAQSRMTAAIDPAVHAMGVLTAAGSDSLPRLADAIGSVANRFNTFITTADSDGRLATWIAEGLDGFTNLGNIALNVGKSFTAITEAAGGGNGLLGTLESATGAMSTFLNSTGGQVRLASFFAEGRETLGQLRDVAIEAGPVLASVFNVAHDATAMWLPVIRDVLAVVNAIPGGAETAATAFIAWKSASVIGSIATLAGALSNIGGLLDGLPGKAGKAKGALGGLGSAAPWALAAATLPVAIGVGEKVENGANIVEGRVPRIGPDGNRIRNGDNPPAAAPAVAAAAPTLPSIFGSVINPSGLFGPAISGELAPSPAAMAAMPSVAVPELSSYVPPVVTQPSSGGSGSRFSDQGLVTNAARLNDLIAAQFPQIAEIGGYRANGNGSNDHPSGKALDIMIPDWNTEAGKALGDSINQWLHTNASSLGIDSTIWQDTWTPVGGQGKKLGRSGANEGHYNHIHAKVNDNSVSGNPASALYPSGMYGGAGSAATAGMPVGPISASLRDAYQRVDDRTRDVEQRQERLNELQAKGTATARQLREAEDALARAQRERGDAVEDLAAKQQKLSQSQGKSGGYAGSDHVGQLGQDLMGGMLQMFGFDGSLFGDPSQFGITKLLAGGMNWATQSSPATAAGGAPMGGAGGGGSLLSSFIPKAFGALRLGNQDDAPVPFMGGNPGYGGGTGLAAGAQFAQSALHGAASQAGSTPGPGNGGNTYNNGDNITINSSEPKNVSNDLYQNHTLPRARAAVAPIG
ncbi:hypothetical protein BH11ACT6_BH11ACT6_03660 [soil metagenome]